MEDSNTLHLKSEAVEFLRWARLDKYKADFDKPFDDLGVELVEDILFLKKEQLSDEKLSFLKQVELTRFWEKQEALKKGKR